MPEPIADWMRVLDQIERSLRENLERVPEPGTNSAGEAGLVDPPHRAVDETLTKWEKSLDRAEQGAREIEQKLADEQTALQSCLEGLAHAREALLAWVNKVEKRKGPRLPSRPTTTNSDGESSQSAA